MAYAFFGRFAPYLERDCLRSFTPCRSSETAHDVVANTRQVLHAAAAHEHDAVLLQVVAFAADVGNDLENRWSDEPWPLYAAPSSAFFGVVVYTRVHTPRPLRAALQRRRLGLRDLGLATVTHELVDGRHW